MPSQSLIFRVRSLLLLLAICGAVSAAGWPQPEITRPTGHSGEAASNPLSTELDRRIRYEQARLAIEEGHRMLAFSLLGRLAIEADETPEGVFYQAVIADEFGESAERSALALRALEALEKAGKSDPQPWFFDDLTRVAARAGLAERVVESERELEAVLARHYEARGGLEELLAIQSMVIRGTLETDHGRSEFRIARLRPSFYRFDLATAQGQRIDSTNGRISWRASVAAEGGTVRYLEKSESVDLRRGAPFDDVLLNFRQAGTEVFLAGRTSRDGRAVHRLEALYGDGGRETIYLDVETSLELLRERYDDNGEVNLEIRTEYAEHGGTRWPAVLTVTSARGMTRYHLEEYDFTTEVPPWIFDGGRLEQLLDRSVEEGNRPQKENPPGEPAGDNDP